MGAMTTSRTTTVAARDGTQILVRRWAAAEQPWASVLIVHSGFDRIASEQRLAARKNYVAAWPEVLWDLKQLVPPAAA